MYSDLDNARALHAAKGTQVLLGFVQRLDLPSMELQAQSAFALGAVLACGMLLFFYSF